MTLLQYQKADVFKKSHAASSAQLDTRSHTSSVPTVDVFQNEHAGTSAQLADHIFHSFSANSRCLKESHATSLRTSNYTVSIANLDDLTNQMRPQVHSLHPRTHTASRQEIDAHKNDMQTPL